MKTVMYFFQDIVLILIVLLFSLLFFIPYKFGKYEWGYKGWKEFVMMCFGYWLMARMNRYN